MQGFPGKDDLIALDAGSNRIWATHGLRNSYPHQFLVAGGTGAMGLGGTSGGGRIATVASINMGSKAGRYCSLFAGTPRVVAEGAMQAFTLQLAQEFGPDGMTCNAVCPDAILTPRVKKVFLRSANRPSRARLRWRRSPWAGKARSGMWPLLSPMRRRKRRGSSQVRHSR